VSRVLKVLALAATLAGAHDRVAAREPPAAASAASSASAPSDTSGRLQEVTVTARRAEKLAREVSKFVNRIAGSENAEGLPLWTVRVCPLVAGLPRQEGEFILERVSEIARQAGVPLAGENCRPNLFIVVTADPKRLLRRWDDRNSTRIGVFDGATYPLGGAPRSVIDAFIATPRAVRVWYNTGWQTAWGQPIFKSADPYQPPAIDHAEPSRLLSNVVYTLARVFVIADQTRLHGLTIGQFADYVSMVGLSKLKPGARLGDARTILKLFDGAPQAVPAGMTDWDQAFLKSLYATEQRSKLQRGEIARAMVREVAH